MTSLGSLWIKSVTTGTRLAQEKVDDMLAEVKAL